ncbi:hypothetical protein SCHPADRAFT_414539 [Schizopora paradoxa]|uniref:Uncharacterized protein n=1 Tax=Schizopora paradoxa TaxID=27342 RepID=A0A0H2RSU3_9AGAM|nr:hypothetical protein SCHPADRAFT_414539 [Schizopora paradoxa]
MHVRRIASSALHYVPFSSLKPEREIRSQSTEAMKVFICKTLDGFNVYQLRSAHVYTNHPDHIAHEHMHELHCVPMIMLGFRTSDRVVGKKKNCGRRRTDIIEEEARIFPVSTPITSCSAKKAPDLIAFAFYSIRVVGPSALEVHDLLAAREILSAF